MKKFCFLFFFFIYTKKKRLILEVVSYFFPFESTIYFSIYTWLYIFFLFIVIINKKILHWYRISYLKHQNKFCGIVHSKSRELCDCNFVRNIMLFINFYLTNLSTELYTIYYVFHDAYYNRFMILICPDLYRTYRF